MAKPTKPPKLRPDANEVAFRVVQGATGEGEKPLPPGEGEKHPEAVERGRKGGKVEGGHGDDKRPTSVKKKRLNKR